MEKRGMSHIEVILAFALFLGAVLFIFYLFNPVHETKVDKIALDELLEGIKSQASTDVTTYWVKINNPSSITDNRIAIDLLFTYDSDLVALVKDIDGNSLKNHINKHSNEGILCIGDGTNNLPPFISIIVGKDFTNSDYNSGCSLTIPEESQYKVSSSYKRTILSERKLEELKTVYGSNYQTLKTNLNILNVNNFDFKVVFSGKTIESTRTIPEGVEINAINKRMEVLRSNGEIEFADILIRMW